MPSKKKKYNARFPAGRIKKIMQTDEEVGKVAQAVPIIISRTLELFVESLLTKSMQITQARSAKTLTPSHMKQCILSESRFDFLKDLVKNVPDASVQEDNENNALFETSCTRQDDQGEEGPLQINSSPETQVQSPSQNIFNEQSTSTSQRTPVIQYVPKMSTSENKSPSIGDIRRTVATDKHDVHSKAEPDGHLKVETNVTAVPPQSIPINFSNKVPAKMAPPESVPPLAPLSNNSFNQNTSDNLCIDEDYDN